MKVEICVGSSCHLKGSHDVVRVFQEQIEKNFLDSDVELSAQFCCGNCAKGVSVVINGELIDNVNGDNALEVFNELVLKKVRG